MSIWVPVIICGLCVVFTVRTLCKADLTIGGGLRVFVAGTASLAMCLIAWVMWLISQFT